MGPNTQREALIAELLGKVDGLLKRVEALENNLPAIAEGINANIQTSGETVVGNVRTSGERFLSAFDQRSGAVLKEIQEAARDAKSAARIVEGTAGRFVFLAGAIGLGGGIVGGILAGLALNRFLFG